MSRRSLVDPSDDLCPCGDFSCPDCQAEEEFAIYLGADMEDIKAVRKAKKEVRKRQMQGDFGAPHFPSGTMMQLEDLLKNLEVEDPGKYAAIMRNLLGELWVKASEEVEEITKRGKYAIIAKLGLERAYQIFADDIVGEEVVDAPEVTVIQGGEA